MPSSDAAATARVPCTRATSATRRPSRTRKTVTVIGAGAGAVVVAVVVDGEVVVGRVVLASFEPPQPATAPESAMMISARLLTSLQFGRVG